MIEIRNLSHQYGDRQVLKNVSFTVEPGKLTGFVGANGAGKTTTMRAMLGLIRPTAGEVLMNGRPMTAADRVGIGYMPEERGLYPKMKLHEQIVYFAQLHGVEKSVAKRRADELIDRLGLTDRRNEQVEALSLGNQQRAQICVALVHEPNVLVLDEPFSGLDPLAVEVVLDVLQQRAALGAPVLFSSHQLEVVEKLSDNLVIISAGEIKAAGTRQDLQEQHSQGLYRIGVTDEEWLAQQPGVEVLSRGGSSFVVRVAGDPEQANARAQQILRDAVARGPVTEFAHHLVPLTTIFKEVR